MARYCIIVTWWSGSDEIQAWSWWPTGFLQCFDDTVGLVIWPLKIVPEMTHNVLSGTLSLYTGFSINFQRRSYNTLALPCQRVIWQLGKHCCTLTSAWDLCSSELLLTGILWPFQRHQQSLQPECTDSWTINTTCHCHPLQAHVH